MKNHGSNIVVTYTAKGNTLFPMSDMMMHDVLI